MPYPNKAKATCETHPWVAQVKIKGKKYSHLCKTKAEAKTWEVERRKIGSSLEIPTVSLYELGSTYLDYCQKKGISKKTYDEKVKAIRELLQFKRVDPHAPAESLATIVVFDHLQGQAKKRGGGGANKDLKNLKSMWSWGVRYLNISSDNPFVKVDAFPENVKTRVVPELDDFWKVVNAASTDQDRLMLLTYLYTAARRDELFRLEWKHIDFKRGLIMLRTRKNDKGEWWDDWISLDDRLVEPLREHQKVTGFFRYVFVNFNGSENPKLWEQYKKRQHWLKNLCARAEVDYFGCHGIRHLCASILADENVPLVKIQHHLRHRSITTTAKYIHGLNIKKDREAVRALPGLNGESENRPDKRPDKSGLQLSATS